MEYLLIVTILYVVLLFMTFATENFIVGSFMFFVGLMLGFMLADISIWLTIFCLLFDTLIFYKILSNFN